MSFLEANLSIIMSRVLMYLCDGKDEVSDKR